MPAILTTLVSAACVFVAVNASPKHLNPKGVPPGFTYTGCYTEASQGRALSADSYSNDNMTVESCAAYCNGNYQYIGVEYARECYCGQYLNNGSVAAPGGESDCNMACGGNSAESCGGGNRLNIYVRLLIGGPFISDWT
jgi:hypothetical protein